MEKAKRNYYTCDSCRYTFTSDNYQERCVDCGKLNVRYATKEEIKSFHRIRQEIEDEIYTEWELLLAKLSA